MTEYNQNGFCIGCMSKENLEDLNKLVKDTNKTYYTILNICYHLNLQKAQDKFKHICRSCSKRLADSYELRSDIVATIEATLECKLTDTPLTSIKECTELYATIRSGINDKYKNFTRMLNADEKLNTSSIKIEVSDESGVRTCPLCGEPCTDIITLNKHMNSEHNTSYICKACGRTFDIRPQLDDHITTCV